MESEETGIVRSQIGQHDQYEGNPQPATPSDTAEVDATCFSISAEANNVRAMNPARWREEATAMTPEKLAEYVAKSGWGDVLRKLVQLKPYVEVLWGRFGELKPGEMIAGCRTKEEFCEKCLCRSIRAVQYMLYGRTPAKPKANIVRPGSETPGLEDELVSALIAQGYNKAEAAGLAKAATGSTFQERFKSALASRGLAAQALLPPPLPPAQPPSIIGDPVPEPEPGSVEELRQRISRMADVDEINETLEGFLHEFVKPLLEHHPYTLLCGVWTEVSRDCNRRIAVGDWVEYLGGSERLSKQIGQESALGTVVAENGLRQPKIRWHGGQGWTKPYNLYEDDDLTVRVLFGHQAAELFSASFACPLSEVKVKQASPAPVEREADEKPQEAPLATADGAVEVSVSEYYGEFAVWVEPPKKGDTPFNTLATREEAEAQAAVLRAGGFIDGMAPRKRPTSAKVQTTVSSGTEHGGGAQGVGD